METPPPHDSKSEDFSNDALDMLSEKRVIMFDKEVTESTCSELIAKILLLNMKDRTGKKPIYVLINSIGGETYSSLGIVDVIRSSRCPVYTVCIGSAQSAACTILLAGHKRFALPNTRIMAHCHWQQYDAPLTHHQLMIQAQESKRLYEQLLHVYTKYSGLTKRKVDALLSKDSFFTAEEAKKIGLIDEIGWDIYTWLK